MEKVQNGAPRGLTVAVVGSRRIQSDRALMRRLDWLLAAGELAAVVSGGAEGVDQLAATWARTNGVRLVEHLPDYQTHGPSAPHIRNLEIVRRADLVLVVWDGQSQGTLSAARHAARLGKPMEWLLAPAPPVLARVAGTARPGGGSSAAGAGAAGQLGLFGTAGA